MHITDELTSSCFGGAPSITTVNIRPNLAITSIGSNAFSSFRLKYFNIGDGTTISRIDSYAFADTQIETFFLECDVYLSSYAFKNCTNLKSIGICRIKRDPESTSKKLMSIPSGILLNSRRSILRMRISRERKNKQEHRLDI